jgi:hypothetical protein
MVRTELSSNIMHCKGDEHWTLLRLAPLRDTRFSHFRFNRRSSIHHLGSNSKYNSSPKKRQQPFIALRLLDALKAYIMIASTSFPIVSVPWALWQLRKKNRSIANTVPVPGSNELPLFRHPSTILDTEWDTGTSHEVWNLFSYCSSMIRFLQNFTAWPLDADCSICRSNALASILTKNMATEVVCIGSGIYASSFTWSLSRQRKLPASVVEFMLRASL